MSTYVRVSFAIRTHDRTLKMVFHSLLFITSLRIKVPRSWAYGTRKIVSSELFYLTLGSARKNSMEKAIVLSSASARRMVARVL